MPDRINFFVLPVLLIFWVFSSVAIASEDPYRLQLQGQWFESPKGLILMAAEDTASHDFPEASESHSPLNFEQALQEYFSRPWSVMLYHGFGTSTDLGQTLLLDIKSEDSHFTGLVATRIHHRSGAFRLFNGTRGGSNFLALGLRYHF